MKMTLRRQQLPLKSTFRISRGAMTFSETIVVELSDGHQIGLGEAPQHRYYARTLDSIEASLEKLSSLVESIQDNWTPESLWDQAYPLVEGDTFALSAFDQATNDLFGKQRGVRVFETQGLIWGNVPLSSVTLSIGDISEVITELRSYRDWPIYKIKLGTPNDLATVRAIREETDAILRVDANCAWNVGQAIELSYALKDLNVEFMEQPLPASATDDENARLYEESYLPIIADESCRTELDIAQCQNRFHGINLKLCKCGGLTPAFRMLRHARDLGLKTMVGCMIESDIAICSAAQLTPLLDYVDLDGSVLLASQPASGFVIDRGHISMPQGLGCGAKLD